MAGRAAAQACGALACARAMHHDGAGGYVAGLGPGAAAAMQLQSVALLPQGPAQLPEFWQAPLDVEPRFGDPLPYGTAVVPALPLGACAAPWIRGSHRRRTGAGARQPAQLPSRLLPSSCESPSLHRPCVSAMLPRTTFERICATASVSQHACSRALTLGCACSWLTPADGG